MLPFCIIDDDDDSAVYCRCSSSVESLCCTNHPTVPTRCVASCLDASVRIISPVSGDVITTFLTTDRRQLLSAAYAVAEGMMSVQRLVMLLYCRISLLKRYGQMDGQTDIQMDG